VAIVKVFARGQKANYGIHIMSLRFRDLIFTSKLFSYKSDPILASA